jgi:hypothetical protein
MCSTEEPDGFTHARVKSIFFLKVCSEIKKTIEKLKIVPGEIPVYIPGTDA